MWVFSRDAEQGITMLQHDLRHLSQKQGTKFGYLGLLKIAEVCGICGASIFLGAFLMQHFLGLF